jgi:hypothetical protein
MSNFFSDIMARIGYSRSDDDGYSGSDDDGDLFVLDSHT